MCTPNDYDSVKTIIYFNSVYKKDGWLHTIITILYDSYLEVWNFLWKLLINTLETSIQVPTINNIPQYL